MHSSDEDVAKLHARRDELKAQIASVGDLRPGFLFGRYRKCGRPNCHCARRDSEGHGPSWSLTRRVNGTTVTRVIPSGPAVERTREHLAEYKRFKQLVDELIATSERLCDARIESMQGGSDGAPQKGGSKRRSTRRWRGRSKR
jgi:hypothetical protein